MMMYERAIKFAYNLLNYGLCFCQYYLLSFKNYMFKICSSINGTWHLFGKLFEMLWSLPSTSEAYFHKIIMKLARNTWLSPIFDVQPTAFFKFYAQVWNMKLERCRLMWPVAVLWENSKTSCLVDGSTKYISIKRYILVNFIFNCQDYQFAKFNNYN